MPWRLFFITLFLFGIPLACDIVISIIVIIALIKDIKSHSRASKLLGVCTVAAFIILSVGISLLLIFIEPGAAELSSIIEDRTVKIFSVMTMLLSVLNIWQMCRIGHYY